MAIRIGKRLFLPVLKLSSYLTEGGTVVLNMVHIWTCPIVLECILGGADIGTILMIQCRLRIDSVARISRNELCALKGL